MFDLISYQPVNSLTFKHIVYIFTYNYIIKINKIW